MIILNSTISKETVFVGQAYEDLTLETGVDMTGDSDPRIVYKKPNGLTGSWVAVIEGTKLKYNILAGDLDKPGLWKFQAYGSGGEKRGEIVELLVERPLVF